MNKNIKYIIYLAVIIVIVTVWRIFQAKAETLWFFIISGIIILLIFIFMYYFLKKTEKKWNK